MVYSFYNMAHCNLTILRSNYERELFTLSDGGILAMEWNLGAPKPDDGDNRPILMMFAGIGSVT